MLTLRSPYAAILLAALSWLQPATAGKNQLWEPWPKDSYYATYPQFHQFPDESGKKQWAVYRLGPVGIGIDLTMPAFGMKVRNVEEGSPAEATGKLKKGQIIESINGQTLKDIDPRVLLGNLITKAEATDGKVIIRVKDAPNAPAQNVLVQIPVLGAYSPTWPLNCPKSDKIVRGEADYLAEHGNPLSALSHDQSLMFLLSTGEEKDLKVARDWVRQMVEKTKDKEMSNMIPWAIGYGATGLCEYYLRTGDQTVLPLIKKVADQAARLMYNGGWNQRTRVNFKYGHMSAAGVHCVKFLLLAKECGVDVDDYTLQTSLRQFFRFTGRGNVPYGDGLPEGGFVDNGKVGGLAFTMAAAASLSPQGEESVYAKARDISAVKGFYSTSWMLHGHTGGGIGEIWRSSAMALMHEKKPTKFREFMDNRTWHLDLSRRFDGSMCILRDTDYSRGYDNEMWGAGYAMTYTIPRKTLRMTGAPPTQYSHKFELPERPWGTAADDAFYSLLPAAGPDGRRQDVDAEKLVSDASWPILRKVNHPDASDEFLLQYCRHPDYNVRQATAKVIRDQKRDHLIPVLLGDRDPRVRHAGVMVIWTETTNSDSIGADRLTNEMIATLSRMIADRQESWWIVQNAMAALSMAPPNKIAPSIDVLLGRLKQSEWWMQRAAIRALIPLLDDSQLAKRIIPEIGEMATNNTVGGVAALLNNVVDRLRNAPPEIKELARENFVLAYEEFPVKLRAPGGADMSNAVDILHGGLASAISSLPGGFEQLYISSRKVLPDEALPYKHLYFNADFSKFGPELRKAMPSIVLKEVIPEYIGANIDSVSEELNWMQEQERSKRTQWAYGELDELIKLYNEIDIHDYDWQPFGPERDKIRWDYFTFDAPEVTNNVHGNAMVYIDRLTQAESRVGKAKARIEKAEGSVRWHEERNGSKEAIQEAQAKVEEAKKAASEQWREWLQGMLVGHLPQGMEFWFSPEFDPSRAGWKTGLAPFANNNGELKVSEWRCKGNFCGCGEPPNTFWDNKGVLLMRTTLKVPPLKPGHRYRLLVGGNIHSKQGAPITIYINGKPVHQQGGFGGRLRGKPRGIFITKELMSEFESGQVVIGVAAVRNPNKAYLTCFLEEMEMPSYTEEQITDARSRAPMLCSEWQELQDPETGPADPNEGKHRYNGRFVDNAQIRGSWSLVARVNEIDEFNAKQVAPTPNAIEFYAGGKTNDPNRLWSGDKVLHLEKKEALQMTVKNLGGKSYLFIESGGFDKKHSKGWQSPLFVLQKVGY
jgi:hypothetical protein